MADYSYCTFENGWLRTRGLHRHGFPMLLWDALVQTGYGEEVPEYRGRLYEEHGLPRCEVHVDIPSHPLFPDESPWSTWVIGNDMDDAMEKAAHVALTALCSQRLPDTAGTPISLYPIQDLSDPEWKARIDEACNVFLDHYHGGWAYMARYAQHMFQLQHDTQRTVAGQCCRLGAYAREVMSLKLEIERLGRDHSLLRQDVRVLESRIRDKDQELLTIYRCSSERDQELLRHRSLLREAEEAFMAKAQELQNLQAAKAQEIEDLQEELQEREEELQEHEIELANKDNEIANLQAQIHQLQLQQAPAPVAPAADPAPSSDVEDD